MYGPTSHNYFSQRLRLHYVDWGNEAAPPLLMIHGGRDRTAQLGLGRAKAAARAAIRDHRNAGSARAWRQPMGVGRQLQRDQLRLRHRPARASEGARARHDHRPFAGRFDRAPLFRDIPRDREERSSPSKGLGPSPRHAADGCAKHPIEATRAQLDHTMRRGDGRGAAAANTRRSKMPSRACRKRTSASATNRRSISPAAAPLPERRRHLFLEVRQFRSRGWAANARLALSVDDPAPASGAASPAPAHLALCAARDAGRPIRCATVASSTFKNARLVNVEGAAHWVHHDKLDVFMREVEAFLAE